MKRLLIIVRRDSAIDSYLADVGFIYDKVVCLHDRTCYTINVTDKMALIKLLISKFRLKDYSISRKYDSFRFRVRS